MKFVNILFALLLILSLASSTPTNNTIDPEWEKYKHLFSIPAVGGARFHPSKEELIFVSNKPGVFQIYHVGINRKEGKTTTPIKRLINTNNRVSNPRYLNNGHMLYYHDHGGDENYQIGLFQPETGKHYWLTDAKDSRNLVNLVTKRYMYFSSNTRTKKKFDLYRRARPLTQNSAIELLYTPKKGVVHLSLVNRDETKFVISHHYSNLHSELIYYDLTDKSITSLTKPLSGDKPTRWIAHKWLNLERTKMLVRTDYKNDFLRPAILYWPSGNIKVGKPVFIRIPFMEKLNADVISLINNRRTGYTYIEINKEGYSKVIRGKLIDGDFRFPRKIKLPFENALISHGDNRSYGRGWAVSKDGKTMAITMTSSVIPSNIYMINLHKNAKVKYWKLLTQSLLPVPIKKMIMVPETLHRYKSFDGLEVPYFLYIPRGKMPKGGWPTIVKLHGGPESQARPEFNPLIQYLTANGLAIAEPNIRGSRGYGKVYMNLDNQGLRINAIKDIKYLALHLRKHPQINGKRLAVMGGSYGGYATLMAVVTFPKLWKAGVDVVGMSNLVTFLKNTSKWRRILREPEYGSLEKQRDMLERLSPINYVDNIKCPVFIIQGDNDPRVPLSEAIQMYNELQEIGKIHPPVAKSKLLRFSDEGHGFAKQKNKLIAYKALQKWLKSLL